MATINIQDLKQDPSRLFAAIEDGQVLIILENDVAIATVQPVSSLPRKQFIPGTYKGEVWIADDFDAPMDIVDAHEVR